MSFRSHGSSRADQNSKEKSDHAIPGGYTHDSWVAALSGVQHQPAPQGALLYPESVVQLKAHLLTPDAGAQLAGNILYFAPPTFERDDPYIQRVISRAGDYCVGLARALPLNQEVTPQHFVECLDSARHYSGRNPNSMKPCDRMAAHTFLPGPFAHAVCERLIQRRERLEEAIDTLAYFRRD